MLCSAFFFFTLFQQISHPQTSLTFNRLEVNFPEVKLFVQVRCGQDVSLDMKKDNFTLRENGLLIEDFSFYCPDPSTACCLSVALIFDRSGSMAFKPLADAKIAGKSFVDKMRDQCDEATVLSFATLTGIDVAMTKNKNTLKAGIDALATAGETAVWDASIRGIEELNARASNQCKAIVLLTDGDDNKSSHALNEVIANAVNNGIRVFTIGLNVGQTQSNNLARLARETGGKYFLSPTSEQLLTIYNEIADILAKNFVECVLTYQTKCKDGSIRSVDLTLSYCGGIDTKSKQYIAPRDSTTFDYIPIRLGSIIANGLDEAPIPLILGAPIDNIFNPFTCTILYDTTCLSFVVLERNGFLLDRTPILIRQITGGIQLTSTIPQFVSGSGILALLRFRVLDLEKDRTCSLILTDWNFNSGCLIASPGNGQVTVVARKPIVDCTIEMPQDLVWSKITKDYVPNPFQAKIILRNTGNREARGARAQIIFNPDDFDLSMPTTGTQLTTPEVIQPSGSATAIWNVYAKLRTYGDTVRVCIKATFNNHLPIQCCKKIGLPPPLIPILRCNASVPPITRDEKTNSYLPMPFNVTVDVVNTGGIATDSVFVHLKLPAGLSLAGSDAGKSVKVLAPFILASNGVGQIKWQVQHAPTSAAKEYLITACAHTANADSTCCEVPVIIPALSGTILLCNAASIDSVKYDDVKLVYTPDVFPVTLSVENRGALDADSVYAHLNLPPDFILVPPNQPLRKFFSPMKIVRWDSALPPNQLTWMVRAKKTWTEKCVTVSFDLHGKDETGVDVTQSCGKLICIPSFGIPSLSCLIDAPDSLSVNPDQTSYSPNPFVVKYRIQNTGTRALDSVYADIQLPVNAGITLTNGDLSRKLASVRMLPGTAVDVTWNLRASVSVKNRIINLECRALTSDSINIGCSKLIAIPKLNVGMVCVPTAPDSLLFKPATKSYSPDPFTASMQLSNVAGQYYYTIRTEIFLPPELELVPNEPSVKMLASLFPGTQDNVSWNVRLKQALTTAKEVTIRFTYKALTSQQYECTVPIFIGAVSESKLTCSIMAPDSIRFTKSSYSPSPFPVRVNIVNTGALPAQTVRAYLLESSGFEIIPPALRLVSAELPGFEIDSTSFLVNVRPHQRSGVDTIRVLITSDGVPPSYCELPVWVASSSRVVFDLTCKAGVDSLRFSDATREYFPNPFAVTVDVKNSGEGDAVNCSVAFVGTGGFTIAQGLPVQNVGTISTRTSITTTWNVRALPRSTAGWDTLIFQAKGYESSTNTQVISFCRVPIYIPSASDAAYVIDCTAPIALKYDGRAYVPNPFLVKAKIVTAGLSGGQNVSVSILLPQAITLASGETLIKKISSIPRNDSAEVTWKLSATNSNKDDTVSICMTLQDDAGRSATCCSRIFIPSSMNTLFGITCTVPDSLRIDPVSGGYQMNPFDVTCSVVNPNVLAIDSVYALLLPLSPDVKLLSPAQQLVSLSLAPGVSSNVKWNVEALPRSQSGFIRMKIIVWGSHVSPVECIMQVYVPPVIGPVLSISCATTPRDTLHFNLKESVYELDPFIYSAQVINTGTVDATNIRAVFIPSSGITLASGEVADKFILPSTLHARDTGRVAWKVQPIRKDYSESVVMQVQVNVDNAPRMNCLASLFIEGAPESVTLSIPQNIVGVFGDELFIPIVLDDVKGKNITRHLCIIGFDSSMIRFKHVITEGTMTGYGWNVPLVKMIDESAVEISGYTTNNTSYFAKGELIILVFQVVFGADENDVRIGTTNISFKKATINNGKIFASTTDGKATVTGFCVRPLVASDQYQLFQNKPNPFNPTTRIEFNVPEDTFVNLTVLDAMGRTINVLLNRSMNKGRYTITFEATSFPGGVYFYKLSTPNFSDLKKMVVLK